MLRKSRTSPKLFSDFNTLPFASVMAMVVFVLLLVFMTVPIDQHMGDNADLPQVSHPIPMAGALREDAMLVTITRDGKVYFGGERISALDVHAKIEDRLRDREIERKIYIVADARARWGTVKEVLSGVRGTGVIRLAFLVDQRRVPGSY